MRTDGLAIYLCSRTRNCIGACLICGAIGLLCPIALAVLGFTGTICGNGCLYGLLAAEAFQQILLLSVMPVTEHKLKNKFNEDGTLR